MEDLQRVYKELLDSLDGIVWEVDTKDFRFTFVSNQCERLLGYTPERWLKELTWKELIHPDDREHVLSTRRKATEEKRNHSLEYRMVAADGLVIWVRDIATVIVEHDCPVKLCGVLLEITERKRAEKLQSTQLEVSLILAESSSLTKAAPLLLKAICNTVGWELGAIWLVDHKASVLRCDSIWHLPSIDAREFLALSREMEFRSGAGLPGRVWASGEPVWITDVVKDPNFPRAPIALKVGFHGAFCFPIQIWSDILGVIEFFSREIREPDSKLLDMMTDIGIKIANFIERKRNEEKREKLIYELQSALVKVKALSGLLPICAACKKIRDDKGYWKQLEDYITDHSEAQFTHGICTDCARKLHPDWDDAS